MREVPVRFGDDVVLAGTLTLPDGPLPVPAVAIASGSGPLDRDSNHRRMRFDVARQLAHALAAGGLASLRYDKRGVGESSGDWRRAGLGDNAEDLRYAVRTLAERPEVDASRIQVAGHSEGALLAAMVAADGLPLTGAVLLSMSATPGDELLRWQTRQIVPTLPGPVRALLRLFRVDLEAKVAKNHTKVRATTTDVARIGGARVNARWFREFLDHDPRVDLRRLTLPVLAVTGSKDLQVDPADLDTVATLVAGPATVERIPDLTHTLRRQAGPPSLRAYKRELREPVDATLLEIVVAWCRATAGLAVDAPSRETLTRTSQEPGLPESR